MLPTPHIAGDPLYCHQRCFTTACQEAIGALRGERLRFAVTVRDADLYAGRVA